jgi:hypothetical protein
MSLFNFHQLATVYLGFNDVSDGNVVRESRFQPSGRDVRLQGAESHVDVVRAVADGRWFPVANFQKKRTDGRVFGDRIASTERHDHPRRTQFRPQLFGPARLCFHVTKMTGLR